MSNMKSIAEVSNTGGVHNEDANAIARGVPEAEPEEVCEYVTSTCGSVTVVVRKPTEEEVQEGIRESARVMRAFFAQIGRVGVTLPYGEDVPIWVADPEDPTRVVRYYRDQSERGYFLGEAFVLEEVPA